MKKQLKVLIVAVVLVIVVGVWLQFQNAQMAFEFDSSQEVANDMTGWSITTFPRDWNLTVSVVLEDDPDFRVMNVQGNRDGYFCTLVPSNTAYKSVIFRYAEFKKDNCNKSEMVKVWMDDKTIYVQSRFDHPEIQLRKE